MESQGHGVTPLTVIRGGSFAMCQFVHLQTPPPLASVEWRNNFALLEETHPRVENILGWWRSGTLNTEVVGALLLPRVGSSLLLIVCGTDRTRTENGTNIQKTTYMLCWASLTSGPPTTNLTPTGRKCGCRMTRLSIIITIARKSLTSPC